MRLNLLHLAKVLQKLKYPADNEALKPFNHLGEVRINPNRKSPVLSLLDLNIENRTPNTEH